MAEQNIFQNPLFSKFLMNTGLGMMGQRTLGQSIQNGMKTGLLGFQDDLDEEKRRKDKLIDAGLLADRADASYRNHADYANKLDQENAASSGAAEWETNKKTSDGIIAELESRGEKVSDILKASAGAKATVEVLSKRLDVVGKPKGSMSKDGKFWIPADGAPTPIAETPEEKRNADENTWQRHDLINNAQTQSNELAKQKAAQDEWDRQNNYKHNQILTDKQNESNKAALLKDQSELDVLNENNAQLLKIKGLQVTTTTGPILGSDLAVNIRKVLPGGGDITKLQAGYNAQLAKLMENWKGNPTDDERKFMAKAGANTSNNGAANLELLDEAITLNQQRIDRVKGRMSSYGSPSGNVDGETKVVEGVTYRKVPGGYRRVN